MASKTYKRSIQIVFILIAIFMLFCSLGEGNPDLFLYDDNISQWLPVINSTFDGFIKTGKINYWNYYLMGGINILDTGIYSILNPLMFMAYIIYQIVNFSNTITIYIYLTMSIAMIVYNEIFIRLGISWKKRGCLLVCLSGCSAYYCFGYWYYVFNNILIGALIMAFFLLFDEKKKCFYFAAGGILAFSIYLGNVQYTIFWYITFAIICLGLFIQKQYQFIKIFISNIVVALLFSIPQIIMNYRASVNNFISGDAYYMYNLDLGNFVIHGLIPDGILSKLFQEGTYGYRFQGMYFVGILPIAAIVALCMIYRKREDYIEKLCLAYVVPALFWLFYTLGKKGIVAAVLHHFPVINNFRCLNKSYFVFVQLALIPLIFICTKLKKQKTLLVIGTCLAVVNLMSVKYGGGGRDGVTYINKCDGLDLDNYRVMAILNEREKINTNFEEKLVLRNYPALFKVYSIGAYNLSYSSEQYALVNRLMKNTPRLSEYAYSNTAFADSFVLDDESTKQLVKNSVRYIFTDSENILSLFEQKGLLADIYEVDSGIWLFEIVGVKPLALSSEGERVCVVNLGNSLLLDTSNCLNEEKDIRLSFSYNERYKAYYINSEGEKVFCSILPDEDGYVMIHFNGNTADKIYLSYSDVWSDLVMCTAVFADLLLLYSCWCLFGVNIMNRFKLLSCLKNRCSQHFLTRR